MKSFISEQHRASENELATKLQLNRVYTKAKSSILTSSQALSSRIDFVKNDLENTISSTSGQLKTNINESSINLSGYVKEVSGCLNVSFLTNLNTQKTQLLDKISISCDAASATANIESQRYVNNKLIQTSGYIVECNINAINTAKTYTNDTKDTILATVDTTYISKAALKGIMMNCTTFAQFKTAIQNL